MKPEIQFIYTFYEKEQLIGEYRYWKGYFDNPDTLMAYAISQLEPDERGQLVKISTCVYNAKGLELPVWYIKSNGKFWLDDLEKHKAENGIISTVDKDYIAEWISQNS